MPESTLDAADNAAANGLNNIIFHTGSVPEVLKDLKEKKQLPKPSVVVVDPPRIGLDSATIQHMLELSPEKILYVSCNPVTQSQNLTDLIASGYSCEIVQPVDQFPHTPHIENIVILKRKS